MSNKSRVGGFIPTEHQKRFLKNYKQRTGIGPATLMKQLLDQFIMQQQRSDQSD